MRWDDYLYAALWIGSKDLRRQWHDDSQAQAYDSAIEEAEVICRWYEERLNDPDYKYLESKRREDGLWELLFVEVYRYDRYVRRLRGVYTDDGVRHVEAAFRLWYNHQASTRFVAACRRWAVLCRRGQTTYELGEEGDSRRLLRAQQLEEAICRAGYETGAGEVTPYLLDGDVVRLCDPAGREVSVDLGSGTVTVER